MSRSGSWAWYGGVAVVGLMLALGQVWMRLQVVAVGYKLSSTRQLIHSLEGERQALRMQWSALTAPTRLAAQAERRLGLSAPQPEQMVRIR
jgi:hypothetical protein